MRSMHWLLAVLLFAGVSLTSCQKETNQIIDQLTTEEVTETTEDVVTDEAAFAEVDFVTDEHIEPILLGSPPPPGDCPTITRSEPFGVFPVTITIDFGDGCEGPDGKIRSGQIVTVVSEYYLNEGATRTTTLVDFTVDSLAIEGTRIWTNNGVDDEGNFSLTRTTTGAKVTFSDGTFSSWEANHTLTQVAGFGTLPHFDNAFEITGQRTGITRTGANYSSTITVPLLKKNNCPWIVSGVREISRNGQTARLDYGDGSCDKWGTLTLADGTTKQIKLRSWHH